MGQTIKAVGQGEVPDSGYQQEEILWRHITILEGTFLPRMPPLPDHDSASHQITLIFGKHSGRESSCAVLSEQKPSSFISQ